MRVENGLRVGNAARDALAIDSSFHESSGVRKDVSIDGRMGVWIVKAKLQGNGNEVKTGVWHWDRIREREGVLVMHFFLLRDNAK